MFSPVDRITEDGLAAGMRNLIGDGVFAETVGTLTGGVMLMGYGMSLGASGPMMGLLAAVPFLTQLLQVPAIVLVEKFRRRRAISLLCITASRICIIPMAFLPFLENPALAQNLLVAGTALSSGLGAMAGCSWNSWIHDLIPKALLGRFFARRLSWATGLAMAAGLAASLFIAWWGRACGQPAYGYSILFLLAAAAGAAGLGFLTGVPESRMAPPERAVDLPSLFSEPFRDRNFRRLIWFLGSWQFATNLISPFLALYLVRRFGFDMTFATMMTLLSQCANVLTLAFWGRLSDRFGSKAVLGVCGPLFLACLFGWMLAGNPAARRYAVPLLTALQILMGCMAAGVNLATGNIRLKLAPREQATAYLAAADIVNALAAGIAPLLVGLFADELATHEFSLALPWGTGPETREFLTFRLHQWDFFLLLSCVLGIYSLHRLRLVDEPGGHEVRAMLRAATFKARRRLLALSSVAGFRLMAVFPPGPRPRPDRTPLSGISPRSPSSCGGNQPPVIATAGAGVGARAGNGLFPQTFP